MPLPLHAGATSAQTIGTENDRGLRMTLRITTIPGKNNQTTIRLEGRLAAEGVEDLQREIDSVAGPVDLDLSDLQSADPEGVRALRSFSTKGAKLVGVSPYIRQLLDETS